MESDKDFLILTTYHHQHLFWEMSRKPTGKPATVKGHQSSLPSSIAIMGKEVSPASLQNTMMSSTIDNKYLDTIKGGADGDASLLSLISVVLYFISHLCKAFEAKKITSKEKKYRFLRNYFQNLPEYLHNSFKTVIQTVEHIDEQKTNSIAIPESSLSFAAVNISVPHPKTLSLSLVRRISAIRSSCHAATTRPRPTNTRGFTPTSPPPSTASSPSSVPLPALLVQPRSRVTAIKARIILRRCRFLRAALCSQRLVARTRVWCRTTLRIFRAAVSASKVLN
jgi:hypothetical protein